MYNDELKKALEETYRERMNAFNIADEQHEFSPEFEKKMKKLIRSAEHNKTADAEDFAEVEHKKVRFSAAKWIAVAASFCLLAAGGVLLVNMLYDNNILNPWTDSSYESNFGSSFESTVTAIPAFIEYNGLELPTAGAYKKEGNMDFCYYDFAIVKRYDPSRLYYHTTDGVQNIPNDVNDDSREIGKCLKLHVGDEVGGLAVSKASSRYSIKFDENGKAYFQPKDLGYNSFTLEGDIQLSGILEYNATDSVLCVDPAYFGEMLPYIPAEFEDSGSGHVPTNDDFGFDFSADSGFMLIHIDSNVFDDYSLRTGGLYEVLLSANSITIGYYENGAEGNARAAVYSVDVLEVKAEKELPELPAQLQLYDTQLVLPTDKPFAETYNGYEFAYDDFAIVRELAPSELVYDTSERSPEKFIGGNYIAYPNDDATENEAAFLRVGDKVGDMTVTAAGSYYYVELNSMDEWIISSEFIPANEFILEGNLTMSGTLAYDESNNMFYLYADPESFKESLPYLPYGNVTEPSTLAYSTDSTNSSVAVVTGYPLIMCYNYETRLFSGLNTSKTYQVTVTVDRMQLYDSSTYNSDIFAHITSLTIS